MKRFVSLALAAAMTLSLVPVSAFAATDNRITTPVLITKGDVTGEDVTPGELVIVNDKKDIKVGSNIEFELNLTGGEWISESDGLFTNNLLKATVNTFDATAASTGVLGRDYVLYTVNADGKYEKVNSPVSGKQYIKVEGTSSNLSGLTTYGHDVNGTAFEGYATREGFKATKGYSAGDETNGVVYSYDEASGTYKKQTPAEGFEDIAYVVKDEKTLKSYADSNAEVTDTNGTATKASVEAYGLKADVQNSYTYDAGNFTGMTYGVDYVIYKYDDIDSYNKVDEGSLSGISSKKVVVVTDEKPLSKFDASSNLPTFISAKDNFDSKVSGASCTTTGNVDFTYTATGDELKLVKFTRMSDTKVLVEIDGADVTSASDKAELRIQLGGIEAKDEKIEVAVTPISGSAVSASKLTVGTVTTGATLTTTEKVVDIRENEVENLKPILIEETDYETFVPGKTVTLKLNSGFQFVGSNGVLGNTNIEILKGDGKITAAASVTKIDSRTVEFKINDLANPNDPSRKATAIKISGLQVKTDGAKNGDVAEITVSGAGTTKQTIEVGKVANYGVTVKAQDKDLPIIYSGVIDNDDTNNETLELTVEENTVGSWLSSQRTTTFKFPEGVKIVDAELVKKNCDNIQNITDFDGALGDADAPLVVDSENKSEATLKGLVADTGKKMKYTVKFTLNVAPNYTGDIACEVSGAAVGEAQKATIAKAVAPISVEAEKTSVAIDYRNVAVGDITITEAAAGVWEKDRQVILEVDNMQFESGIKVEKVEGDGDIKAIDVKGGRVTITVDSESSKTPMKLKLSNVSLYLDRTLPAGDYALKLVSETETGADANNTESAVMFETFIKDDTKTTKFNVDEVVAIKDYVTVSTAGRDQGTTFTTEVKVTIDSTTLLVDGKEVTLDVPAYLSAEGWTMLPVRAVTEALASASNSQPVDWIAGNPGTIMIYYGDKTVAMTLGSTTMYINGTPVPMSTAPVIVNDRAFLPMRDLGRALGLSDSQIAWDAATRTATFNPAATTTAK